MNIIRSLVLGSAAFFIFTFNVSSSAQESAPSQDMVVKITNIKTGYIHPKYTHRVGTNLAPHWNEKSLRESEFFGTKRNVAIGAKFKINSSRGNMLQIASMVTASSQDKDIKSEKHLTLSTVENGETFSHWRFIKSKKDKRFTQWHFEFLLIAVDDDIVVQPEDIGNLESAIHVYETTFSSKESLKNVSTRN